MEMLLYLYLVYFLVRFIIKQKYCKIRLHKPRKVEKLLSEPL